MIKGSKYNIDPAGDLDSQLAEELAAKGQTVNDLPTEVIPTPFVQVRGRGPAASEEVQDSRDGGALRRTSYSR